MKMLNLATTLFLAFTATANAATLHQVAHIPDRYFLGEIIVGAEEKAKGLKGDYLEGLVKQQAAESKVHVVQLAAYVSGEDKAAGPFLLLESVDGGEEVLFYDGDTPERSLLLARLAGYPTSVKELVDAQRLCSATCFDGWGNRKNSIIGRTHYMSNRLPCFCRGPLHFASART